MDTALPLNLRLDPFAHELASGSDDDVFSFFLGPSPTIGNQSAYMKRNVDKFNMPENYIGQNLYLRDTMVSFYFVKWKKLICFFFLFNRKIGCLLQTKRGIQREFCLG